MVNCLVLWEVVNNFLDNGIKYIFNGGFVEVSFVLEKVLFFGMDWVILAIVDMGYGIFLED